MFEIILEDEYLMAVDGSSEGTQRKYFKDGYWYKQDSFGGEATAEVLSSAVLKASSLPDGQYVVYEQGMVNGKTGCRSKDFTMLGEEFITLYRYYQALTGRKIHIDVNHLDTPKERADFVLDFFVKNCGLDLSDYFSKIFTLDAVILNEDRHFNNLGIIRQKDGSFRTAPIFDNGKSLLVGNVSVKRDMGPHECVRRTIAQPFSGSFKKNRELFGIGFTIDYALCKKLLASEPDSFEKEILLYQLDSILLAE